MRIESEEEGPAEQAQVEAVPSGLHQKKPAQQEQQLAEPSIEDRDKQASEEDQVQHQVQSSSHGSADESDKIDDAISEELESISLPEQREMKVKDLSVAGAVVFNDDAEDIKDSYD